MSSALPRYFWDVEAVEWDKPVCAVVTRSDGHETRFRGPTCLEGVAEHMRRHRGVYCAHFGGGYDVPLLLNVRGFSEIVLTGTNILIAREGRELVLRDTYPWWLAGLKKVGEAVGVKKWEEKSDRIEELSPQEIEDHCANDNRVGNAGVDAAQDFLNAHGADDAWTAGSSAVSLVRALEPGQWKMLMRHRCNVEDIMQFLDDGGGRGGRTDSWSRGVVEGVTSLDFKSSYPARYAFDEVPIGLQEATESDPVEGGVYLCEWQWWDRERIPPAVDFGSACGVGHCSGWLTDEEIWAFESCGVKVKRIRGWRGVLTMPVGQIFAAQMFKAKEGDGPGKFFSKVWLNSWHGKALEHPAKEHFTAWRPSKFSEAFGEPEIVGDRDKRDRHWFRYYTIEHGDDGKCAPYQQPVMGENILGRARAALWRAFDRLQRAGYRVLYCDTDSIHTTCPLDVLPQVLGDVMGDTLGKLAVEATGCTGYYLGPKAYLLVDDNSGPVNVKDKALGTFFKRGDVVKQALKGIPLRSYAQGTIDGELFREASQAQKRAGHASDVRVELFKRALYKETPCLKDGVSTFLRGLHGFDDAQGVKVKSRWGRAPSVRKVRVSGRGKTFHLDADAKTPWEYVSTVETCGANALKQMTGPMSAARWSKVPDGARAWLVGMAYVRELDDGAYARTADGVKWLESLGSLGGAVFTKPGRDDVPAI